MANTQSQFGFQHFGYLPGFAPDYQQIPLSIQSTYSTVIGYGDPVIKVASGSSYIIQATAALATASPLSGIFLGCQITPSTGLGIPQWSPWYPGAQSVDSVAYVMASPGALFRVAVLQTAIVTANIGQGVNFTTSGLTVTTKGSGYSIMTVDQATLATSASNTTMVNSPFKVYSMFPGIGNGSDPTTNFNWVIVAFNQQQWKSMAAF